MFSNIEEICAFHRTFLQRLKAARPLTVGKIGTIFTDIGEKGFMVYEEYYVKHPKAAEFLQMKQEDDIFSSTLMGCQLFLDHKLPLNFFLLKPVQRLLKYPLLINEMLKATEASSMDYKAIERASTLMTKVATNINEIKRNGDITKYVTGLQQRLVGWDGPDLTTFGKLKDAGDFKVADSSNKRSSRQVLLFEYGILICKLRPGSLVSIKHHFQMSDLFLQTMLNDPILFRLTLANNKKVFFTFHCQSQEDKQYWIAKIKKVMIDFYRNLTTREKEAKEGGGSDIQAPAAEGTAAAAAAGSGNESSSTSSPKLHRKGMQRGTTRKRFNSSAIGSFANTLPPVRKEAETDEKLTHNPFAQAGGFNGDMPEVKQIGIDPESSGGSGSGGGGSAGSKFARAASKKFSRRSKHRTSAAAVAAAAQRTRVVSSLVDDDTASVMAITVEARNSSYRQSTASSSASAEEMQQVAAAVAKTQEQSLIVKCNFPGNTQTSCIVRSSETATILGTFRARMRRRDFSANDCHIVGPRGETIAWNASAFPLLKALSKLSPDPVVLNIVLNLPLPASVTAAPAASKPNSLRYSQLSEAEQERLDLEASQTFHSMQVDAGEPPAAAVYTAAGGVLSRPPAKIMTKFLFDLVDIAPTSDSSSDEKEDGRQERHGGGGKDGFEACGHAATASFLEASAQKPKKVPGSPSLFRRVASYAASSIKGKVGSPSARRKRTPIDASRREKGRTAVAAGGGSEGVQPASEARGNRDSQPRFDERVQIQNTARFSVQSSVSCPSTAASPLQRSSFPPASAPRWSAVLNVQSRSAFDAASAPAFPLPASNNPNNNHLDIRHEEEMRPRSASEVGPRSTRKKLNPNDDVKDSQHGCNRDEIPLYARPPRQRAAPPPPLPPRNDTKVQEFTVRNTPRPPPPPPPAAAQHGHHQQENMQHGYSQGRSQDQLSVKKPAPSYPGDSALYLKKPAPAYSTVSIERKSAPRPASTSSTTSSLSLPEEGASECGNGAAAPSLLVRQTSVKTPPLSYRKRTTAIGVGNDATSTTNLRRSVQARRQYDMNGRPIATSKPGDAEQAGLEKENLEDPATKVAAANVTEVAAAAGEKEYAAGSIVRRRTSQKRAAQSDVYHDEETALLNRAAASSQIARHDHANDSVETKKPKLNFRKRSEPRRHTEV